MKTNKLTNEILFLEKCVDECDVHLFKRTPCMPLYVSKDKCKSKGCCYDHKSIPTCFHSAGSSRNHKKTFLLKVNFLQKKIFMTFIRGLLR